MGRREYTDRREFEQCRGYIRESAGAIFNYVGRWGAIFASVMVGAWDRSGEGDIRCEVATEVIEHAHKILVEDK